MPVKAVPEGYHTLTPTLIVDGAARLIEFLTKAFGAQERMQIPMPDGKVAHAECLVGDSLIMLSDATPQFPATNSTFYMYVENADSVYERALAAGATSEMPLQDMFYGDRSGSIRDPFGNRWTIATHIEDVSDEEAMKRMASVMPPT